MIPILYESNETQFTSNGLGRLRDCIECLITEERNGIYECDFSYPMDGAHFDDIILGRIIAVTHDDSGDVQPFDIVSYSKPIEGVVAFHAVHISYRQLYLTCYGSNINSITQAFQLFATAQPSNPFSYDADFTSSAYMAAADTTPRSVRQMIGGVEGSFLDAYGGEILWDRFNVHFLKQRGVKRDFSIRYGVNMLDFNDETDYSGSYSSCIPFWHGQDSTGNEITVIGSRVDYGGASYNGRNDCVPLDLTEKFESQPTSAQLESMATSVMNSKQPNLPSQNIKVDFVRLQDMAGYEEFEDLLQCNLCDTVDVVFPDYSMQGSFKIVRTVYDSLSEKYTEMELGSLSTSLAEALGISNTPNPDRINENFYVDADGNLTANGSGTFSGALYVNGRVYFPNGSAIYYKDSGGNNRYVFGVNSNNLLHIGYELYSNSEGTTTLYGNNLGLTSRNPITISQPIASFFKITQEAISSGTISAGSYANGTSHTITAQSGYHAVGIVGWATTNYRVRPTTNYIASDTSLYCGFSNLSSSSASATITFRVLWLKATSA